MNLCPFSKFKNMFGIPGKGIHQYTLMGTAMVDYVLTLILAFVWSYITSFPLVLSTIMWFVIALILHILFGVQTNAVKYLGIKC